jgi:hypothetical protein
MNRLSSSKYFLVWCGIKVTTRSLKEYIYFPGIIRAEFPFLPALSQS